MVSGGLTYFIVFLLVPRLAYEFLDTYSIFFYP